MDQTIKFDKSLQERLAEYNYVLSDYEKVSVSELEKVWSFYLELTLDPNGWQAIWKIQRRTCEDLNIPFPSVALVYVLEVIFNDLTAVVKILGVLDDIHIPERHIVPLIHLWPTKVQDKSIGINLMSTANSIDMLRFFYNNLYMPWDVNDKNDEDWRNEHLESRLRLFYDMKNGVIPPTIAEHIHAQITEAKRLQAKKEAILMNNSTIDRDSPEFYEIETRLIEIKNEIDILEAPHLRDAMIKRYMNTTSISINGKQITWLVFDEGKVDDYINFLTKVKAIYPNNILKFSSPLVHTLEQSNPGDIFLLNEGLHLTTSCGILENGGILKGLSTRDKTKITTNVEDKMFDLNANQIIIENITINAFTAQCAIILRRGTLYLNNCKIVGDGKSSTHQGIIILKGATLNMENCEICNFSTAIIGNSGSKIFIKSSQIHNGQYGLKIYDDCMVKAENCTFSNCNCYGICVETEKIFDKETTSGTFDTLNIIPHLKIENVNGINNKKGDALINQKSKLMPIEDLFENPELDPTICKDSDDEMDNSQDLNCTIQFNPEG